MHDKNLPIDILRVPPYLSWIFQLSMLQVATSRNSSEKAFWIVLYYYLINNICH